MNALDYKSLRLNTQLNVPSPSELAALEMGVARTSKLSYYSQPLEVTPAYEEDTHEPNQDSIKVNEWKNPKASRTVKPQRQSSKTSTKEG